MGMTQYNYDNIEPENDIFYGVAKKKEYFFEAHCMSEHCLKNATQLKNLKVGALKRVPKGTTWCPQCEHALLWVKFEGKNVK